MLDPRGSKITTPRSDYGVERMIEELTRTLRTALNGSAKPSNGANFVSTAPR
jgi:hypothetical protein